MQPNHLRANICQRLPLLLLFLTISLACHVTAHAQNNDVTDKYAGGKKLITGLSKILSPNGVQENFEATLGGTRQWVFVRGQDRNNPVILFVHGGPASPMAPVAWTWQRPLEEYFTMVQYDQRASGKSFLANDTTNLGATLHIDRYVDDCIELAEQLRQKYHKKKLVLMGHSWGTIVAMRAALKRPDLFYVYVGAGQNINTVDNERVSFEFGLKEATRRKDTTAIRELQSIAPYPGDQPITRDRIIIARKWPQEYGGLAAYRPVPAYFFNAPLMSPEYDKKDVDAIDEGNIFTLGRVMDEFLAVDFKQVKEFPIPVLVFMGRHDYTTPSEPTDAWLKKVKAPYKKGVWFENSSHLMMMEEPGKFLLTLVQEVRPMALK
ncbi:alpha/beta fold hydrolase [Chitinophaga varians]|uniref:alpha/beta fold hydrolase n=1 Tax=Chitinophaga varians TaxID=2202339 RepID=UPI00165FD4B0|nr:alpha/beta hydrolase [Chitinophaga varians]MBC9909531.1 alpha/beta hydrolase [Chitinophaga varians]